jgi:hypothetical protein
MKRLLHIFILSIFLTSLIHASEGDGGYAGAFLRMGIGARAKSMGDAYSAIPQGAMAGIYNPALLPHLKEREALVSFAFLPLDRSLDLVCYAQPLSPKVSPDEDAKPLKAGFSLAWVHAGVDNIDGRDGSGNHIGYFSNSEHAFYLSFAISPAPFISLGVGGKVLYNRFPKLAQEDAAITSTGFGIDVGVYVTPIRNLMLGVVVRDNLSKYTWNTDKLWDRGTSTTYKFPKVLRSAIAYKLPQDWLLLAAEIESSEEQNPRYHFGAELSYLHLGALRLGYDDGYPTFGLGFNTHLFGKKAGLNYAFIAVGDAPRADHIFSWTFTF